MFISPTLHLNQTKPLIQERILPCNPYKKVCNLKQLFAPCDHFMERPPSGDAVIKHFVNI